MAQIAPQVLDIFDPDPEPHQRMPWVRFQPRIEYAPDFWLDFQPVRQVERIRAMPFEAQGQERFERSATGRHSPFAIGGWPETFAAQVPETNNPG